MLKTHRIIAALLIAVVHVITATPSSADTIRQIIKNKTGKRANDLTINRAGGVDITDARIRRDDNNDGKLQDGETKEKVSSIENNGAVAKWITGDIKNVEDGDEVFVEVVGKGGAVRIGDGSEWTFNNQPIGNISKVGDPGRFAFNTSTHEGFATFFNPDPFAITYTNVAIYLDNDLANFASLDTVFTPTGHLVGGFPTFFTLDPGQSMAFALGAIDLSKYALSFADVAPARDLADLYSVASAAAVPEPSTVLLFGVGSVTLLSFRRRRR